MYSSTSDTINIPTRTPGPLDLLSFPPQLTLPCNCSLLNKQAAVTVSPPDGMEDHEQGLSATQIKKYSNAFRMFDTDKDGNINGKDLGQILRHIGHNPTEAEIQVCHSHIMSKCEDPILGNDSPC